MSKDSLKSLLSRNVENTTKKYLSFVKTRSVSDSFDLIGQEALGNLDSDPAWNHEIEGWFENEVNEKIAMVLHVYGKAE